MLAIIFFSSLFSQAAVPVGTITLIRGEVELNQSAITKDTPVFLGDIIETVNGRATLLLGKESVLHISPKSKLKVDQFLVTPQAEASNVNLEKGKVRALVRSVGAKKAFSIRTRSATMGVRGTQIIVESPEDPKLPAQFATLEGSATVQVGSRAQPVEVKANEVARSEASSMASGVSKIELKAEQTQATLTGYSDNSNRIQTTGKLGEDRKNRDKPKRDNEWEVPKGPPMLDTPPPPIAGAQTVSKTGAIEGTIQ